MAKYLFGGFEHSLYPVEKNFAAPIYGAYFLTVTPIPKDVPPFFIEMAEDDNLAGPQIIKFYDALKAAGYKPNFTFMSTGVMAGACARHNQRSLARRVLLVARSPRADEAEQVTLAESC
jgi:hypothetical protein